MREAGRILGYIKPKKASEAAERRFISHAMARLKKEIGSARIVLAGSFAKGTFLEGDRDIDIFVLFRHSVEKEAMEGIIRAAVEGAFPGAFFQVAYAQHPYVRVFTEGRKIDVVPAYEVGHGQHFELRTAVDRSQLHTDYILSKMSQKQKDEVRLLKRFLKANLLYGAEIKVQGFSGYLCELLILRYGAFEKAVKSVSQWRERTLIDLEGKLKKEDALAKFASPLVVIDPVDRSRNVSAVVSEENYESLISLSRAFAKSRNKVAFFAKKAITAEHMEVFLKKRNIYCISFEAPEVVDDVLWGQVRRFHCATEAAMRKEGFETIGYGLDRCGGNICILLELLNDALPATKIVPGPPLRFVKDCEKFSAQYKKSAFVHEGRMMAKVKRDTRTMEQFFGKIRKLPLPSHLDSVKNAKLYKGAKIIENCREALSHYVSRKLVL